MANVIIDPIADWGASGVALYYQILNAANVVVVARTNTNVTESPVGSKQYHVTGGISVDPTQRLRIVWDDGTSYGQESLDPYVVAAVLPANPLLSTDPRLTDMESAAVFLNGLTPDTVVDPPTLAGLLTEQMPAPVITPLMATLSAVRNVNQNITLWQREGASFSWLVTDANGNPAVLTNRTLVLYLYSTDAAFNPTPIATYGNLTGLSISGSTVTVQFNPTDLTAPGVLRYNLWDITDPIHPLGVRGGLVQVDVAYRP